MDQADQLWKEERSSHLVKMWVKEYLQPSICSVNPFHTLHEVIKEEEDQVVDIE